MGILGIYMIVIGGILMILMSTQHIWGAFIVVSIVAVIGVGIVIYDNTSPIVTETKIIMTSEPHRYGFNILKKETDLIKIKVTTNKTTRPGAIFGATTDYQLILADKE